MGLIILGAPIPKGYSTTIFPMNEAIALFGNRDDLGGDGQDVGNFWESTHPGLRVSPSTKSLGHWGFRTIPTIKKTSWHIQYIAINQLVFLPSTWPNYSDLTRPHPKLWFSKRIPVISGKSRLVKYYNLARSTIKQPVNILPSTNLNLGIFSKFTPTLRVWQTPRFQQHPQTETMDDRWWQLKDFLILHPEPLGFHDPIWRAYFFRWVGWKTTNQPTDVSIFQKKKPGVYPPKSYDFVDLLWSKVVEGRDFQKMWKTTNQ